MTININFPNYPKNYGCTPWGIDNKLPSHLKGRLDYKIIKENWEPDGGIYAVGKRNPGLTDIPYIEIPTGIKTFTLEFPEIKQVDTFVITTGEINEG